MAGPDLVPPLVSVITPVYNGSAHVGACIDSVARSLTFGQISIEHILVDDGSTDRTLAVIEEALAALPGGAHHISVLRISHSGKPACARNRALEVARGKYIFCLDHDDLLLQNTLRYLANHLESTGAEVAYGDFLRFNDSEGYEIGRDYYGWPHEDGRAALYSMFRGDHFYQHSFMFTRRLFEAVGGYDETITYGEDLDLCTRFILAGHLPAHLPITTHIHRNHARNLTGHYAHRSTAWLAEWRAHYDKYRGELGRHLTPAQIEDIEEVLGFASTRGGRSPGG